MNKPVYYLSDKCYKLDEHDVCRSPTPLNGICICKCHKEEKTNE